MEIDHSWSLKCSISTDMTIRLKKWRQRHSLQGSQLAECEAALLGLHLNHKQIRADLQGTASSYCIWPWPLHGQPWGYYTSPPTMGQINPMMQPSPSRWRAQKIMGCILTYFLKHDALLTQWHSFAMPRYLHPEDCNLLFLALSTDPWLSSLFHSSVCSLRSD